jgi:hypothetical protein
MQRSPLSARPRRDDVRPPTALSRRAPLLIRGLVLLALLTLVATAAEAQLLGRLRRAVTSGVAARETAAPRLEITTERIDVFLVAMRPVVAHAEAVQAARAAQTAYDTRQEEIKVCKERLGSTGAVRPAQLTAAQQERIGAMAARTTELMAAYQSAAAAGNLRVATAVLDSMDLAGHEAMVMQYPALAACGAPAPRPLPPPPPPAPTQGEMIAQAPGGMTGSQFGRLREMIAVYLLTSGRDSSFTGAERTAFDQRSSQLASFTPLFRSGALEWAQWANLGKNWHAK